MYSLSKPVFVCGGRCDNPSVSSVRSDSGALSERCLMSLELSLTPALGWLGRGRAVTAAGIVCCDALAAFAACAAERGECIWWNTLITYTSTLLVQSTKHRLEKIYFLSLTSPFFCLFLVFVQLTVPPHSTTQLPVRFCPTALGRRNHKATITFQCPKVW